MDKIIFLRTLTLINFKGIKSLTVNFNDQENSISGDNATGKTTVMDAFTYLLFDKDSFGRKDFNIKRLTQSGEPVHRQETEVSAVLQVNDETINLKKIYREKWTKPRGQSQEVFSGHETEYYYNSVPLAMRDYQAKIEAICPEKIFKLLTSPIFFPGLNWSEQRSMLISIAGAVSDEEVAGTNKAFKKLLSDLAGNKTVEEYKREIAMKKKRIKEDIEQIPARIDEVKRGLPEIKDWKAIETNIKAVENSIRDIDSKIADAGKGLESENAKRIELQGVINQHKSSRSKIDNELTTHIDNLKFGYERRKRLYDQGAIDFEETISQNQSRIKSLESLISTLEGQRQVKITEWQKINAETLKFETDAVCPTCGQDLPEDFLTTKKTEAENKFNTNKASRLADNVKLGKQTKSELEEARVKIETCKKTVETTQVDLTRLLSETVAIPDYVSAKESFLLTNKYTERSVNIAKLEKELTDLGPAKVADTSELQGEKSLKHFELDALKKTIATRDQITSGNTRIETLTKDLQRLSQELADFEQIEFTIAGFNKAKIEAVEAKINGMFGIVRFKMFNQQINGGEQETCECTVEGVPYSDLNNAMKINAGIDILSTLSNKYGIKAPIFLDNRESVNKILKVQSQLINLVVTKDKTLIFN